MIMTVYTRAVGHIKNEGTPQSYEHRLELEVYSQNPKLGGIHFSK
jgi:hypothetical protein